MITDSMRRVYDNFEKSVMVEREMYYWCMHVIHAARAHSLDLSLMDEEHKELIHRDVIKSHNENRN
jgi:hypothetical protein